MIRLNNRGQITLLDLILAPIAAVILAVFASLFLSSSTANLLNMVNQQPSVVGCNFALTSMFGAYFVHTAAAFTQLSLSNPDQYSAALSTKAENLSTNCGSSCASSYVYTPNLLTNSSALYNDFIQYFSSFSVSSFNNIKADNYPALSAFSMQVFLNQVPSGVTAKTICSLKVFNPADPGSPYTIYGVLS